MKNKGEDRDSGLLSTPLSFLRSGLFIWVNTGLNGRGGAGCYWSLQSVSTTSSNSLYFYNTAINPQSSDVRGYGFAVLKDAIIS